MAEQINRWKVVFGAILIQLCLGAIYAWSAFTEKLTAADGIHGLSKTETQIIFSSGLISYALSMALLAGRWQKKAGPRKVAVAGGIVLGLGYILAGLAGESFWGLLLGIGLLGGIGIGLGYVCPIAALVNWFPDKKGFITGLAVAGFGFGALIWIKLTTGFVFGPVNLTPGWHGLYGMGWNVSQVFILYGVIFAVLVGLGSRWMVNPPEGWRPEGWVPPTGVTAGSSGQKDFSELEMVKTKQFWLLFFTFTIGAMAGLKVIGIISLFGVDKLTANGVDPSKAKIITGTAWGLFGSLLNGFGRIAWGLISDRIGRKNAIVAMMASQGIAVILLYFYGGYEWGLYLLAGLVGFNFGGTLALLPAATADYFGNKNVGTNYPLVFIGYGVGGLLGPILGGIMGDAQDWKLAFIPAGLACLAMAFVDLAMKPPYSARQK